MNTYSHFLMTAVLREQLKARNIPVHTGGVLLGSVLPDVPLIVLTVGYIFYYRVIAPLPPGEGIFSGRYDALYFDNPVWITLHSLGHAPLLVALLAGIGYYGMHRAKGWGVPLFWFALACGFHSLVDILTHHDDGPLLFFPFNWEYRLMMPISYWDTNHYAAIVAPLEHLMDLGILGGFALGWLRRRRLAQQAGP